MTQPDTSEQRIQELVMHRRRVAELKAAVTGIRTARTVTALLAAFALLLPVTLISTTLSTMGRLDMGFINFLGLFLIAGSVIGALALYNTRGKTAKVAEERDGVGVAGASRVHRKFADLRLDLELEEEAHLLAAAYITPPAYERQYTYRNSIPVEIDRLRAGGRRYRLWHNCLQWLLILCSAAIPAVTALYEAPQPGKGILIGLGAIVAATTSVMGYYKFRERSFNLQQTADTIEQHLTALDIAITPYNDPDEKRNLERFAQTVESLRDEQRKREQQLDQPHTGQQGS